MTTERRTGAPRLIDWTGERCVPWADDVQVVYEHYHRYLWAAELVRGRRVLDLGSGEGFGSAILAETAEKIVGLDLDATTVEHSRLNHAAPNLSFEQGSALDLDRFEEASFGAVVCFELIEHVSDHERVLAGVERVLADDGLLVISTPDRRTYTDATGIRNPFHERELTDAELQDLLGRHFSHVRLFGQRAVAGSRIAAVGRPDAPTTRPFALRRDGDDWHAAEEPPAMYLVAVASRGALPAIADDSLLSDYSLRIVDAQRSRAEEAEHASAALSHALEDTRAATERALADAASLADERRVELEETYDRLTELRAALYAAQARRTEDEADLRRMRESVVWNGIQRARGKLYGALGGTDTRRARAVQGSLRAVGRGLERDKAPVDDQAAPAFAPIAFPEFSRPLASLIVTAYTGAETTAACLRSIAELTEGPAFEVIVVDDAADADNARLWQAVEGATILVNDSGIGYLRSVNRGAAAARGRYLVLMNNDVEVKPGWLRALVRRAESAPDVGAVAAKLLYPGGDVQEAGGIVFRDGSAWNFANHSDPDSHELNFVREVDYGSAACLLVRTEAWTAAGGYDERFAPMYYEDVDLCFALRAAGWRVVYEPTATVVHHEGATAGTDVSSGSKRYQELNRPKLVEKWQDELERGQLLPGRENVRRASDRVRGPHVLVIDHRVPMPDQDAGSLRMLRLVETLRGLGCRVTFAPDDMCAHEPYTRALQELGVDVLYGATSIAQEVEIVGDDLQLAIVSRPYVAARYMHVVREHAPRATLAYDTVDLHYVRERRRAELGAAQAHAKSETLRQLELGLVRGSDATIVVSAEERRQVEDEVPGARVIVVPVVNEVAEQVPPVAGREGVLFVGGFEHPPNVDAALHLVEQVMPPVWDRLGDVPVVIAGSKPTPEIKALASSRVEVTGWVEDLQPLIDGARVMAAPLRFGAGMKGKITQSLGAGLPVVTTPTGAEGLGATDGDELLIAEQPEALAERIVRLHTDDELWQRMSSAGQDVVRRVASVELMRERLVELLELSGSDALRGAPSATGC